MTENKAPIEEYFPIEQVNEIAEKEGHAKRYYRPVQTIHKWWARRLGSIFRSILLFSLADNGTSIRSGGQQSLADNGTVQFDDPEELWDYYLEDVDFEGKTVLDPFMGGGTTVIEALRTGCNVVGSELNPVAWFVVKKEVEPVDIEKLKEAYQELKENVADEIKYYYETECPACENSAEAMYYFWVKKLECPNCSVDVRLFKDFYVAAARSTNDNFYHVVCPECLNLQTTEDHKSNTTCENCSTTFNPKKDGNTGGQDFTCRSCGQKSKVIDQTEQETPGSEMYAVEYSCEACGSKGYKNPDENDLSRYREAEEELSEIRDNLPIPDQERYNGSFDRARNHGYIYHHQMFNERQLLLLGKLLSRIDDFEDQNIKEFLLITFSAMLESNNMFCMYNQQRNHSEPIFNNSIISPRHTPIEGNIWGAEYGRGTFSSMFEKTIAAKEWCARPFEKYVDEDGETKEKDMTIPVEGEIVDDFSSLGKEGNTLLRCGTSEYLPLPEKSVDAVVTDPPYYDNEMYAEQSDFYYVWLKQILEENYEHFQGDLTPKKTEAVTDPASDVEDKRTEEHYIDTLTSIFSESREKLKDDGLMVFSFSHKKTEAWASVLKSVLDAGFYISAVYPVNSELRAGTRAGRATVNYDMIVVCRKREDNPEEGLWSEMEDEIYIKAKEEIQELRERDRNLSLGDMFVVAIGKCLQLYSEHYPRVIEDGEQKTVSEAVQDIQKIVDTQLRGGIYDELVSELDPVSAAYLSFIAGKGDTIDYSDLNKSLSQRNISVEELDNADVVKKDDGKVKVPDLEERVSAIESKQESNLTALDRTQYLIHLKDEDRLNAEMREWASEGALTVLKELADREDNKEYEEIAEFVEEKLSESSLEGYT